MHKFYLIVWNEKHSGKNFINIHHYYILIFVFVFRWMLKLKASKKITTIFTVYHRSVGFLYTYYLVPLSIYPVTCVATANKEPNCLLHNIPPLIAFIRTLRQLVYLAILLRISSTSSAQRFYGLPFDTVCWEVHFTWSWP